MECLYVEAKIRYIPTTKHSLSSKCIIDFNLKLEVLKLLEEKIDSTLQDVGIRTDFLNRTPFIQELIPIIVKWNLIKLKGFCTGKEY